MDLKLGFYYHLPAARRGSQIFVPGYLGVFIDSLASHCKKVICFLHAAGSLSHLDLDYAIRSENVEWVDLGPHTSTLQRTLFPVRYTRQFEQRRGDLDVLLVRGPSPLLPAFARAAEKLPLALLLVGDYAAGAEDGLKPGFRRELNRLYSRWYAGRQMSAAKHSLTFVNSRLLYAQMDGKVPHLVETRTTTLSESNFFDREDTCQKSPYRLLYTGRMDRSKGLLDMVEAVKKLADEGYDCTLDLVGMVEKGDPVLQEIEQRSQELGIPDRVAYRGYKPLGPELFACYREADIYLLASKTSEGFPRTIWEAMASSLPVVATRVGSIPAYIEDAAELVPPKDPAALAEGVIRLLQNPARRRSLILEGRRLAKANTLEQRAEEMVRCISEFIGNKKNG